MAKLLLGNVLGSQNGWAELSTMPKTPKVAYTLMKYVKTVITPEMEVITEHRNELIKTLGKGDSIEPNTPAFDKFQTQFTEYLATDSDIKPIDLTMDQLIDALSSHKDNAITDGTLMLVEPFFKTEETKGKGKK